MNDTTVEKLNEIASLCVGSVTVAINEHKNLGQSVDDHIDEKAREYIDDEVYSQMIKHDKIVRIQANPHSSVGFFLIHHYDLDEGLNRVLNALK